VRKIRVCTLDTFFEKDLGFSKIETFGFNSSKYFKSSEINLKNLILNGLNGEIISRKLRKAEYVDELVRNGNDNYKEFIYSLNRFLEEKKIHVLVCANNIIHPYYLKTIFKNYFKIIGIIDDPYVTYSKTIPYLWAFDGAFYISPTINETQFTNKFLLDVGFKNSIWIPNSPQIDFKKHIHDLSFSDRKIDLIYVGNVSNKLDRLSSLNKTFGKNLELHGRWRFFGFEGLFKNKILSRNKILRRVKPLSENQMIEKYLSTKIGINMHMSNQIETGNMRMFLLPALGVMQICDKAALNSNEEIFKDGKEIIYYDSINDAKEKIRYFLNNRKERIEIAINGFNRFHKEYLFKENYESMIVKLFNNVK
jgi:spore maturation protein CgeB